MRRRKWKIIILTLGAIPLLVLVGVIYIYSSGLSADIQHHNVSLVLEPLQNALYGSTEVHISTRPLTPAIILLLNQDMDIEAVQQGGADVPFWRISSVLMVPSHAIAKNDSGHYSLQVIYSFSGEELADEVFGNQGGLISSSGIFLRPEAFWYPTLRQAYSTMDIEIKVPTGWQVAFPGIATEEGKHSFRTEVAQEGYGLAAGPYKYTGINDHVSLMGFAENTASVHYQNMESQLVEMVSYYDMLIGATNTPLIVAEIPGNLGKTFIMPGLVLIDGAIITTQDVLSSRLQVAAAVSSNWWIYEVTPTGRADVWLGESMSHYLGFSYLRHTEGEGIAQTIRYLWGNRFFEMMNRSRTQSIYQLNYSSRTDVYPVTLETKGPYVFSILEYQMGKENFVAALRELRQIYQRGSGESLTYKSFQQRLDRHYPLAISTHFSQWVEKDELLQVSVARLEVRENQGKYTVHGVLNQVRPIFHATVPLTVEDEAGNLTTQEIKVDGMRVGFIVNLDKPPVAIYVDLPNYLLKEGPGFGPFNVNAFGQTVPGDMVVVYETTSVTAHEIATGIYNRMGKEGYNVTLLSSNQASSQEINATLVVVGWPRDNEALLQLLHQAPVTVTETGYNYKQWQRQSTSLGMMQVFPHPLSLHLAVLHYHGMDDISLGRVLEIPHAFAGVIIFDEEDVILIDYVDESPQFMPKEYHKLLP